MKDETAFELAIYSTLVGIYIGLGDTEESLRIEKLAKGNLTEKEIEDFEKFVGKYGDETRNKVLGIE